MRTNSLLSLLPSLSGLVSPCVRFGSSEEESKEGAGQGKARTDRVHGRRRVHLGKYMRVNERPLHRGPPSLPRAGALPSLAATGDALPDSCRWKWRPFFTGEEGWKGGGKRLENKAKQNGKGV